MRLAARISGVSPATIRAWERRYAAVKPERTDGNTRMFRWQDVQRLSLLQRAANEGHAIRHLVDLNNEGLEALLQSKPGSTTATAPSADATPPSVRNTIASAYLDLVDRFEVGAARELLLKSASLMPSREFVLEVVTPIVQEVGHRWANKQWCIAQEHLVSAQLKATLSTLLQINAVERNHDAILVATPPGHFHEFGILVGAMLASARGLNPVYLGVDLPFEEMSWAARKLNARVVLTSVVRSLPSDAQEAQRQMMIAFAAEHTVWMGCPSDHDLVGASDKIRYFHDFQELDLALAHLTMTM